MEDLVEFVRKNYLAIGGTLTAGAITTLVYRWYVKYMISYKDLPHPPGIEFCGCLKLNIAQRSFSSGECKRFR